MCGVFTENVDLRLSVLHCGHNGSAKFGILGAPCRNTRQKDENICTYDTLEISDGYICDIIRSGISLIKRDAWKCGPVHGDCMPNGSEVFLNLLSHSTFANIGADIEFHSTPSYTLETGSRC